MSDRSAIEWTDATWNPVRGCTKVSPGCKHCYAETFAERWRGIPGHAYEQGFDLRLVPEALEIPLHWKRPRTIFVNSMSDLFHEEIPFDYIDRVFAVMRRAHWHRFQVLTKRADRAALYTLRSNGLAECPQVPRNVWVGTSIESPRYFGRVDNLRRVPARTRFLSIEPLLEPMGRLNLFGISWVIVGGESGGGAREMCPEWVRPIRDQCVTEGIPFFFKQWGGVRKKFAGRLLDGREWNEMPQ